MSIQRKGSGARLLAVLAAALAAITSCSEDAGRESTDGNTSFLAPCDTNDDCPTMLECLCGLCSRACTSEDACSAFRSATCATPAVAGLECPLRGSLCVSRGGTPAEAGAGGEGGRTSTGGSPSTGGRASGGAASGGVSSGGATSGGTGGLADAGGRGSASGGAGSGGTESDGAADGGACVAIDVPGTGSPCSIDICSEGANYQIRVTRDSGWYVGALWWSLVVCTVRPYPEAYLGSETIGFRMTASEFAALDKDARVYAIYGQPPAGSPAGPAADCGTLNDRLSLPQPIGECIGAAP